MRKVFKAAVGFHLFALACFLSSFYFTNIIASNKAFQLNQSCEPGLYIAATPFFLFYGPEKNENSLKEFSKLPFSPSKPHLKIISTSIKAAELIHINSFSNYIPYSIFILVSLCPADITFPFHYFW